ncbi:Gfo/Idh/MocA family protein [Candidatus Methanoperedens nitratireducens]|uniref:Oxidoreductase domain protein n=1 Tax=Candidatus Methanoperedens nitratireducens TaxID=1392998 RepID=A0A284VPA5_9EURY|nr:Gfo/Idh/MocA family oxidoreductase [Candidatus Methanoperedens nitroreducens]SNQ61105.1 Oxidoreductase domain protein [Candidatus Methanoperedens nitroreducens]
MKVGIIGTGTMGKNHARVYSELKGIEDVYVFDSNKNNVTEMRKMGFIACDSMNELLDYVEAVSICVPTKYHLDVAKAAIEKNVHCLIEKPLAMSVDEGKELLDFLKNRDLIVGVGHIERFNPVINEIRKITVNPFFVEMRRHNPSSSRVTDSSVIEDLMVHDIDIVFNVLFNMKNYKIYSGGNHDVCKAMVAFDESIASISASKRACKKIRTIYIEDENFTIEGDFMTQEIYTYWKPEKYGIDREKYTQENIIEKVLVNKVEPLKVELRAFVDCVKNNTEFPVTPEQALNNLRICEQIKMGFE